jgi:hypothetical protein
MHRDFFFLKIKSFACTLTLCFSLKAKTWSVAAAFERFSNIHTSCKGKDAEYADVILFIIVSFLEL